MITDDQIRKALRKHFSDDPEAVALASDAPAEEVAEALISADATDAEWDALLDRCLAIAETLVEEIRAEWLADADAAMQEELAASQPEIEAEMAEAAKDEASYAEGHDEFNS